LRVVLDTNVWISGLLLPNSLPGEIISSWRQVKFTIVASQYILDEIKNVLAYPKIRKRIGWDNEQIEQYVVLLKFITEFIPETDIRVDVKRDAKDSPVLATLLSSQADYLITGDKDLLELNSDYSIVTVKEFVDLIF